MRAILTPDHLLHCGPLVFPAVVGLNGIKRDKEEGDHATPAGLLPLRMVYYRADRVAPPRCVVRKEALTRADGWCDDPKNAAYNRPVQLPFAASHEELWHEDHVYDIIGVLGWNDQPPVPGRGSAIFLHICAPDRAPTEGCIALEQKQLLAVLAAGLTEIEVLTQ